MTRLLWLAFGWCWLAAAFAGAWATVAALYRRDGRR